MKNLLAPSGAAYFPIIFRSAGALYFGVYRFYKYGAPSGLKTTLSHIKNNVFPLT